MSGTIARCLRGLLIRLSDSSPTPGTKITDLPTLWRRVNRSGLHGGSDGPGSVQFDGAFAERFLGRCLARSWRIRSTLPVAPRALAVVVGSAVSRVDPEKSGMMSRAARPFTTEIRQAVSWSLCTISI